MAWHSRRDKNEDKDKGKDKGKDSATDKDSAAARDTKDDKNKDNQSQAAPSGKSGKTQPPGKALHFDFIAESVNLGENAPERPGEIYFAIVPGGGVPLEIMSLVSEFEQTTLTLRTLFRDKHLEKFESLFEELLLAAQLLAGPNPAPVVAANVLQSFQERLVLQEGRVQKGHYLNKLALHIVFAIAMIILVASIIRLPVFAGAFGDATSSIIPRYAVLFSVAAAAMWLSFATRKPQFTFGDLMYPEADMLGTVHRIIYVLLFTAVLVLFSEAEVVGTIAIGKFATSKISSDYLSAAIFGFACGFSEKLLASTVAPHVSKILGGLSQPNTK